MHHERHYYEQQRLVYNRKRLLYAALSEQYVLMREYYRELQKVYWLESRLYTNTSVAHPASQADLHTMRDELRNQIAEVVSRTKAIRADINELQRKYSAWFDIL
jgi:hypothetical protein